MGQMNRLHFQLSYKRMDRGRFVWPSTKTGSVVMTAAQLSMLLEGIDWRRPERTFTPSLAG